MEIKKGQIKYPETEEEPLQEIEAEQLEPRSVLVAKTGVSVDLDGAAETLVCLHTELDAEITRAYFLYTEASSANAGVTVEVGKESDRDYYFAETSESSKALWYTKEITLLKKDITKGDTVTFHSQGSKVGTGEITLVIEYKLKGTYLGE